MPLHSSLCPTNSSCTGLGVVGGGIPKSVDVDARGEPRRLRPLNRDPLLEACCMPGKREQARHTKGGSSSSGDDNSSVMDEVNTSSPGLRMTTTACRKALSRRKLLPQQTGLKVVALARLCRKEGIVRVRHGITMGALDTDMGRTCSQNVNV